jgi:hypothetical protein
MNSSGGIKGCFTFITDSQDIFYESVISFDSILFVSILLIRFSSVYRFFLLFHIHRRLFILSASSRLNPDHVLGRDDGLNRRAAWFSPTSCACVLRGLQIAHVFSFLQQFFLDNFSSILFFLPLRSSQEVPRDFPGLHSVIIVIFKALVSFEL